MALFWALFLALVAGAHAEIPGCKLRITAQALDLGKGRGRGQLRVGSPQQPVQELMVSLLPQ